MSKYRTINNTWQTILNLIEIKNPNFKTTKSLLKAILEVSKNQKINIYLDQKNINLIKYLNIFEQISNLASDILGKKYSIEIKPQENEYEFLNKQNVFLERINKLNFYYCRQNSIIFKSINNFLNNPNNNVFCLIGNKGIGKTHSMGVFLNNEFKGSFIYIDSFDLINKFYENQRLNKSFEWFKDWISNYELIVIDSFQLIKNEIDLFEIVNITQKVIIITNDKNYITEINERTFFLKMNEPEISDVKSIINNFLKKQNKHIKFSKESIDYLTNHLGNNIQNIINKLLNILLIIGNPNSFTIVDLNHLKTIINNTFLFDKKEKSINFSNNQQVKTVCEKLNFNTYDIFMNTRKKDIVFKRNLVIYILKKKFNLTHEEIGKIFNKNHSTITHSIQKVEKKLEDKHFKKYLDNFFINY